MKSRIKWLHTYSFNNRLYFVCPSSCQQPLLQGQLLKTFHLSFNRLLLQFWRFFYPNCLHFNASHLHERWNIFKKLRQSCCSWCRGYVVVVFSVVLFKFMQWVNYKLDYWMDTLFCDWSPLSLRSQQEQNLLLIFNTYICQALIIWSVLYLLHTQMILSNQSTSLMQ